LWKGANKILNYIVVVVVVVVVVVFLALKPIVIVFSHPGSGL